MIKAINAAMFKTTNLTDAQIEQFYKTTKPVLLPDSKRRQYRLRLRDGTMINIKRKITKPAQLQKLCTKIKPVAVYQTISKWQNPELLTNKGNPCKGGYKWLCNNFLGTDFLIDADKEHCNNHNLQKLANFAKCNECDGYMIIKTGNGYHYWIFNPCFLNPHALIPNPFNREMHYLHKMRKTVNYLKHKGIKFDYEISMDTRRIARVPNTLHENGKTIKILSSSLKG